MNGSLSQIDNVEFSTKVYDTLGTKQARDPTPNRGTRKNSNPGIPKNSRNLGDERRYRTPGDPLFRAQGEPWIPK